MGLVNYQQGEIIISQTSSLSARKSGKVGYVPQNEEIDTRFPLSVYDVVMMGRYGLMGLGVNRQMWIVRPLPMRLMLSV